MRTRAPARFRAPLHLISGLVFLAGCGGGDDSEAEPKDGVLEVRTSHFDSDPTLQDTDHDGVLDWVIRDRESEHVDDDPDMSLENGALHLEGGSPVDSRPRMDYPNHWEIIWSARAISNDEIEPYELGQYYNDWNFPGAQTWINFEYDIPNAHWAAVFAMLYKFGDEQILYVMNQIDEAEGSTNLRYKCLYVQRGLPLGEFVDVKLHLYIADHEVGLAVNGDDKGKLPYELKYEAEPKDDRQITMFVPQGVAEWKSFSFQVAEP